MSYILEALKKAQAERQLGNAPTIHAPQPVQAAQPGAAASRRPLFMGIGAGVLVVALGALLVWHRAPAPAAVTVAQAVPAGQPAAATPAVAVAGPVAAPSTPAATASNRLEVSAPPAPAPSHPAPAPDAPARTTTPAAGKAGAAPQGGADALASTAPARAPAAAPAPRAAAETPAAASPRTAAAPAPSSEDSLPYLRQLPEEIQREMPRVSFGGYMYSANPADRLLLVDKALRHEGEEVAPGLVLEKLLPKAAVMNFRGIRYRVGY
jgi:general secretion pathway protein B